MGPEYYMEYTESKKVLVENYTAYYKFKNLTAWGPFKVSDIAAKAEEMAAKRYKENRGSSRRDRVVRVGFFGDHLECTTGDIKQEYRYDELEGIYETDTTIAFVAGKDRKKDAFLALKKGTVKGHSLADLKAFVLPRCTKITDGVKYI